jgi:hypothetical protein
VQAVTFAAGCMAGAAIVSSPVYAMLALALAITVLPGMRLPMFG